MIMLDLLRSTLSTSPVMHGRSAVSIRFGCVAKRFMRLSSALEDAHLKQMQQAPLHVLQRKYDMRYTVP